MSSPAKKRKLNNGTKTSSAPPKGLEYFFSKQSQKVNSQVNNDEAGQSPKKELTDEEFARKLQDEWNQEVASERDSGRKGTTPDSVEQQAPQELGWEASETVAQQRATSPTQTDSPKGLPKDNQKTLTLQSAGIADDVATSNIPLDESPLTFDSSHHVNSLKTHWATEGGDASYALLTRCFVLVSSTTSRIKTVDTLVNCLRIIIEGDPSSLLPAVSGPLLMPGNSLT